MIAIPRPTPEALRACVTLRGNEPNATERVLSWLDADIHALMERSLGTMGDADLLIKGAVAALRHVRETVGSAPDLLAAHTRANAPKNKDFT